MTKQKAPKAQADSLLWIEQSLRDFGVQGVAVRELIEFLKTTLKSSNAAVRTSATKTLTTLRIFVGPDIKTFIQDLNPTLLTTIEQEFDKVNGEQAPAPTRLSGDNAQAASSVTAGLGKANAGGADALDDLFPRQDITKLIPPSIIKAMGDANWKQRKESLEHIQGVLEANKRLKSVLGKGQSERRAMVSR
jgi:cytoskeleton-associated protein 5